METIYVNLASGTKILAFKISHALAESEGFLSGPKVKNKQGLKVFKRKDNAVFAQMFPGGEGLKFNSVEDWLLVEKSLIRFHWAFGQERTRFFQVLEPSQIVDRLILSSQRLAPSPKSFMEREIRGFADGRIMILIDDLWYLYQNESDFSFFEKEFFGREFDGIVVGGTSNSPPWASKKAK